MRIHSSKILSLGLGITTLTSFGVLAALAPAANAEPVHGRSAGAVYTETNATDGNAVQVFDRGADGTLTPGATYSTGGLGTGAHGFSQGAVELSADGRTVLAVNAGSNQVSDFAVRPDGSLRLVGTVASGGTEPISVAVDGDLVEVLNIGGTANVAGFHLTQWGLVPIARGTQPLSAGAAGAEDVAISPNGDHVVVTEKTSNTIDSFEVRGNGRLASVVTSPSNGPAAFAAAFTPAGQLLVADAGGAGTSALSSYRVRDSGTTASGPLLPNGQNAACWITLGANGQVFVANAGSSSISTYRVSWNGSVSFLGNSDTGVNSKPLDLATSTNGRYVYELDGVNNVISTFRVQANGSLTAVAQQPIPASAAGLAAS